MLVDLEEVRIRHLSGINSRDQDLNLVQGKICMITVPTEDSVAETEAETSSEVAVHSVEEEHLLKI